MRFFLFVRKSIVNEETYMILNFQHAITRFENFSNLSYNH